MRNGCRSWKNALDVLRNGFDETNASFWVYRSLGSDLHHGDVDIGIVCNVFFVYFSVVGASANVYSKLRCGTYWLQTV